MNIEALIKEAKNGSRAAEQCLFNLFSDKMLLVCCRYLKNREDAEEIMLDGFTRFFAKISSFQYQHDAALFAWLKRIMINECLMFLRKKRSFSMVVEMEAAEVPVEADLMSRLSAKEIFALIIQLPVGYRTVFNLYVVEGMEHKHIARLMGITTGTSKSQLSKAKQLLQKMITENEQYYAKSRSK